MIFKGKYSILGVKYAACDYDFLLAQIEKSIRVKKNLLIFPAASHPVVEALFNKEEKAALVKIDYVVPDSQWVRHSLGFLYGAWLPDRVYGPELTLRICRLAEKKGYKIYLLREPGKTPLKLSKKLGRLFPKTKVANTPASADIIFVGMGSPQQEIYATTHLKKEKVVVIPVGAAFAFISGEKKQAPLWMRNTGFEWLFRFIKEPRRLWRRYLVYGPIFVFLILYQKLLLGLKSTLR
jgi:N-acetylglucosaminyldiphosphoundecaprenol N-acetyl-beta-D-mannosaminyltransferase